MEDTRIVVTGGNGRLGQFIVAEMRKLFPTTIVDRVIATPAADQVQADVCDFRQVKQALAPGNLLIHLAGIDASVKAHASDIYRVNTVGTWNVLQAAEELGYRKVILCSSVAALGLDGAHPGNVPQRLPISEDSPCCAYQAYGLSKKIGEEIALAFFRRTGIDTLCFRPALVLFPELRDGFIERASTSLGQQTTGRAQASAGDPRVKEALEEPLPLLRSYIFPEDVAAAFRAAVERDINGYRIYTLAALDLLGDDPLETYLTAAYGAQADIVRGNLYRHAPSASSLDTARAFHDLGWTPRLSWRQVRQ